MSTSIQDLPNELLDFIVQLVLICDNSSLNGPQAPYEDYVSWTRRAPCRSWSYGPRHVRYWQKQDVCSSRLALLLVNRQLAHITRRRLDQLATLTSSLKLDVIVVNETDLLPTWRFLPNVRRHVDDLTATFRIVGTSPTIEGRWQRLLPDHGTPPPILWAFFYLLERFLEVGPLMEHKLPTARPHTKRMPFIINRLNLDFVSPEQGMIAPPDLGFWDWIRGSTDEGNLGGSASPVNVGSLLMRPEWLAEIINRYIGSLLNMGDRLRLHGAMIYEYVGSIRVTVDGNLFEEHRLDQRLKDLDFSWHADYTRRDSFSRWKEKAYRIRRNVGLPVII